MLDWTRDLSLGKGPARSELYKRWESVYCQHDCVKWPEGAPRSRPGQWQGGGGLLTAPEVPARARAVQSDPPLYNETRAGDRLLVNGGVTGQTSCLRLRGKEQFGRGTDPVMGPVVCLSHQTQVKDTRARKSCVANAFPRFEFGLSRKIKQSIPEA